MGKARSGEIVTTQVATPVAAPVAPQQVAPQQHYAQHAQHAQHAHAFEPILNDDTYAAGSGPNTAQERIAPPVMAPRKAQTNPGVRAQSLAQVLAEVEIEDELDIPTFLRRHAPTNPSG